MLCLRCTNVHLIGRRGIRTHGEREPSPVFKTGALNHSASLPELQYISFASNGGSPDRPRHLSQRAAAAPDGLAATGSGVRSYEFNAGARSRYPIYTLLLTDAERESQPCR